ncbi:MAG: LacI family DNA-binding transcriptional regulator [Bacteroidota bacterium]
MAKTNITINDIAKELNVAPSTVSRALNDSSKISEKTKTRIHETARSLGYDLNMIASGLSRQQSNIIGVVIPSIDRHFFSQVVGGIEEIAFKSGYRVIISQTNDSQEREADVVRMLAGTRVDGIIACPGSDIRNTSHLQKITKNGIPLVLFDQVAYDVDCYKIIIDNYSAAFDAVNHLANTGCKKIAYLGGPRGNPVFDERTRGYRDALVQKGLPLPEKYLLSSDLSSQDTAEAINIWLSQEEIPDAILAGDSFSALLAQKIIQEAGINIPENISLVAFGSEPAHQFVDPRISAIEMPGKEIGHSAIQFIFDEINGKTGECSTVIKPYNLVIRNSSFSG